MGGSAAIHPEGSPTSGPSARERAGPLLARAVVPSAHLTHVSQLRGVHRAVTAERLRKERGHAGG